MNKAAEFLRGKKTYGVALVGFLYLVGCYVGWFQFDEKVCAGLGIGFVATFRSALNGIFPKGANGLAGQASSADGATGSVDPTFPNGPRGATGPTVGGPGAAISLAMGCGVLFLTGCAMLDRAATAVTRPGSVVTNVVERIVVQTNLVPIAVAVPGETIQHTNFVERLSVVTNTVTETKTNWVLKSEIAGGLQTAQTGAAVAGVFNPGAGAIGSGVLGVVSLGLGYLARRKNNEARDAREEAEALALQLQAAIEGVEKAGGVMKPEDAHAVKETILKVSQALGVAGELHASVQAITN